MKRERGFTLIELLVVIAILGVLFGLTALALNGLSKGTNEAKAAEKDMVQTAIDVYMAVNDLTSITASTNYVTVGPSTTGFGTYLRRNSKYNYCWDASGNITGQDGTGACP